MSDYTKIVDYAAKDALITGNPVKLVKGTELGAEYDAIAVAIATKANTASPAFTGVSSFAVGAVGAPSIYMTGYATTGWYNIGANNWGFAVSGAKVLDIASTGLTVVGISTVTQSKVTVNTNNLYEAITLTNSSNTSSGMQILTKNGYGNLVSLDMQQVDNGTGADDGVMNIKIATNSTLATVAAVSTTGLAVTGTLSATGKISSTNDAVLVNGGGNTGQWELNGVKIGYDSSGVLGWIQAGGSAIAAPLHINPQGGLTNVGGGLAVTGALSATGALTLSGTGQVLIATAASAADKYVTISNTNGTLEYGVLAGGEGFIGTSTADNLKLQVNGSVVGNLSSTGLAVTGTTSTTTGMAVGGATAGAGGIAFPATAVAVADVNTLDDYQEGTWTPTVAFGGASVGVTYSTQAGRYTIIGDRCFGSCEIILTSKGSSTGAASIGGLPATVFNASGSYSPVALRTSLVSFADFLMAYCNANTTTILLEQTTNAGATSSLSEANFSNTTQIMASFNFKIA